MSLWIQLTCLWMLAALMMSLGWFWQRSRVNAGIVDVLWAALQPPNADAVALAQFRQDVEEASRRFQEKRTGVV